MTSLVDAPIVRKTAISLDCVRIKRSRETAITSPLMNSRIPRMNGIDFDKLSLSSRSNSALNWPRSRTYPSASDSFIASVSVSLVACNSTPSFSSVSLKSKAGVPSKSMLSVFRRAVHFLIFRRGLQHPCRQQRSSILEGESNLDWRRTTPVDCWQNR